MAARLFDCHAHVGASDTGELYYGHLTGAEYLRLMRQAGVERAIVFPPLQANGYAAANQGLLAWCATTGGQVRPLARVGGRHIGLTEPQAWLLRRKLRRMVGARPDDLALDDLPRYAGIKLLPHLDGVPGPDVFARVAELGLPVLTHAGHYVPAGWIERAILPQVRTKLVLAHLGAFPDRQAELEAAVALAARDDRVYLDTSGIWIADFLAYAVERVPGKLLFGSDCPLTPPAVAWQLLASVVRDPGLRARIGHEAAQEVFG